MQNPTAENPPDQNVIAKQQSNDVALILQHEVRLMMLVQLFAHYILLYPSEYLYEQ